MDLVRVEANQGVANRSGSSEITYPGHICDVALCECL